MTAHRRHVIVAGAIAKLPYAGMAMYWLHYIRGLQELGFVVHYVEKQNRPFEYYDPSSREMMDADQRAGLYLDSLSHRFGCSPDTWTLLGATGRSSGFALGDVLADVDLSLVIADDTWFDELSDVRDRVFIDGDPMFTQGGYEAGDRAVRAAVDNATVLFSYGTRIGSPDCPIPRCGRTWLPTHPVVATSLWSVLPPPTDAPLTALLHWAAGSDVHLGTETFGHKGREFEKFFALPSLIEQRCVLAVGGRRAPRERLKDAGWSLADPLEATLEPGAYRAFIAGSLGDIGIAKHAYVASRSGWFSDRATCFLASGRPVLHQETGFRDYLDLDVNDGVVVFADLDELARGARLFAADPVRLAQRARRTAEYRLEARTVLTHMFDAAEIAV